MTAGFSRKVVVVTGGATGIGAATARAFGARGAHVVVDHLGQPTAAAAVVADIEEAGGRAVAVDADVGDPQSVAALVEAAHESFGPVEVLINNAAIISWAPAINLDIAEWERVLRTDLTGVFLVSQAVTPDMVAAGRGKIVNVASDLAFTAEVGLAHYCAAKAGVLGLSRVLALELIRHGINVNVVAPGLTETSMLAAASYPDDRAESIPAGRYATAEEIAATILFLASDDADYFVGSVLSPNGGLVL